MEFQTVGQLRVGVHILKKKRPFVIPKGDTGYVGVHDSYYKKI